MSSHDEKSLKAKTMKEKPMKKTINIIYPAFALFAFACLSLSGGAQAASNPSIAQNPAQNVGSGNHVIRFDTQIPQAPGELALFKLTPAAPPTGVVSQALSSQGNGAKLAPISSLALFSGKSSPAMDGVVGADEGEHLKAMVDLKSGDAAIFPSLGKLAPLSHASLPNLVEAAQQIFLSGFIASDDTRFEIDQPLLLHGATLVREDDGTTREEEATTPYLAYFIAHRFVGNLPVDGVGSRAVLGLSGTGSVEGLTRSWKIARQFGTVQASGRDVRTQITQQMNYALQNSDVVIDSVQLAYYDGNQELLQPVYRFTARILKPANNDGSSNDDRVIGYVPFGETGEALPVLGVVNGDIPKAPAQNVLLQAQSGPPMQPTLNISVGRYVVRNDDPGWVNDANSFWNGLSSGAFRSYFNNSQYYWAYPYEFTYNKDYYANSVNLNLTEVHGDWWYFTTYQNWGDGVNINGGIPYPGYGPSANGQLADWILHSCEVVPTPADTSAWANPWWTVFGGLRNVVGYRTIMYINDGAGGPYGASLSSGAPVVSSWLQDVISLGAYFWHPYDWAHGHIWRPMGRPSAISMCGHENDSALSNGWNGRANCLHVYWYGD
jgi:hypothetical protein